MAKSTSALISEIAETATFLQRRWLSSNLVLPAQVVHHCVCTLAALGLTPTDPLMRDLPTHIPLARDYPEEVGLYSLALARAGHIGAVDTERICERLAMRGSDLAIKSFGTPYGRALLERLTLIESLTLVPHLDAKLRAQVIAAVNQAEALMDHDDWPGRTYPLLLRHTLAPTDPNLPDATADCVAQLERIVHERGELWYGDALSFNSLVVRNVMLFTTLPEDSRRSFWDVTSPLLFRLAERLRKEVSPDPLMATADQNFLLTFGALVRAIAVVDTAEFKHVSSLLASGSEGMLQAARTRHAAAQTKIRREHEDIRHALGVAIAESLSVEADIQRLGGGMSSSEVYLATVRINQPFVVAGYQVIFKTDRHGVHGEERLRSNEIQARRDRVSDLFARVVAAPELVRIAGIDKSIVLYEYLAGYRTLRDRLEEPDSESDRVSLLTAIVETLLDAYVETTVEDDDACTRIANGLVHQVAASLGWMQLLVVPRIRRDLQLLCHTTTELLKRLRTLLPNSSRATMMHGDLNCRNVMIAAEPHLRVRLIDYETLTWAGDVCFDFGEFVEDVALIGGLGAPNLSIEQLVWDRLQLRAEHLGEELRMRYLLGRMRSAVFLTAYHLQSSADDHLRLADLALYRWSAIANELANV